MTRESPVSFRPGPLASDLDARATFDANRNEIAQRDLGRYYELLARSLATMAWTASEALAIADALWSTAFDAGSIAGLPLGIQDALYDDLAERHGVDGPDLLMRLWETTALQRLAIADAIERLRAQPDRSVADVGLVRLEVG